MLTSCVHSPRKVLFQTSICKVIKQPSIYGILLHPLLALPLSCIIKGRLCKHPLLFRKFSRASFTKVRPLQYCLVLSAAQNICCGLIPLGRQLRYKPAFCATAGCSFPNTLKCFPLSLWASHQAKTLPVL